MKPILLYIDIFNDAYVCIDFLSSNKISIYLSWKKRPECFWLVLTIIITYVLFDKVLYLCSILFFLFS